MEFNKDTIKEIPVACKQRFGVKGTRSIVGISRNIPQSVGDGDENIPQPIL